MAVSTDVTLRVDAEARFPDRCVVCEANAPGATVALSESRHGGFITLFLPLVWLMGWRTFHAPICPGCKGRFRLQRWGRGIVTWILVIVSVTVVYPHVRELDWAPRRLVGGGLVLLSLVPYVLYEVFWPRFFGVTVHLDRIDYEFASRAYAEAFTEANRSAVLRSEADD